MRWCIALPWLLLAVPAAAQTLDPIAIDWDAPSGCPSGAEVLAECHRLLGGAPSPAGRQLHATAQVGQDGDLWHLALSTSVDGAVGRRDLTDTTCEGLADAAALVLALAYDPEAVATAVESPLPIPLREPEPMPLLLTPAPIELAKVVRTPLAPPPVEAADHWEIIAGAHVDGDAGSLPTPALGIGGLLALRWNAWRVQLAVDYWLEQRHYVTDTMSGGDFSFWSAALSGGPVFSIAPVELGAVGGFELGRMQAAGFGVDHPDEKAIPWVALLATASAAVTVAGPWMVRGEVGVVTPFTRPRWLLDRVGEVDRPGPVVGRLRLGVEVRF